MNYTSTKKNLKINRRDSLTAAIYIRVSSAEQVNNFSLQTQLEEIRKYLAKKHIDEVGLFIEKGESAKTVNRTQFQCLLHFIAKNNNKVDYLVVYKLDRFSRDQVDFHFYKAKLAKYGTRILSATESIDDSPQGRFLEGIYAALAQLDNENKAERVRANMRTKALDGWYPVKAPYGYMNDPKTKTLTRDPEYFDHIKYILRAFIEGIQIPDIVRELEQRDIKTKRSDKYFTPKNVWKILSKSKFYAGVFDWKEDKNIKGNHEAMITWNEHMLIQNKLYNKPTSIEEKKDDDYILNFTIQYGQGFTHCLKCGERMRSCASIGRGGKYRYYYCKNPYCSAEKKSIKKEILETRFKEEISKLTPKDTTIDLFTELVKENWIKQNKHSFEYERRIQKKIKALEEEKKLTIEMRRNKELESEDFISEMTRIKQQIKSYKGNDSSQISRKELDKLLKTIPSYFKNVEPLYSDLPIGKKRELSLLLFPRGIQYADKVLRTPEKASILNIFEGIEDGNLAIIEKVTPRGIEPRSPG